MPSEPLGWDLMAPTRSVWQIAAMTDLLAWRRLVPAHRRRQLRRTVHRPRWGNLRRLQPFSDTFGFDRGTPIDRYYMHRFLAAEANAIRGDAGEIAAADYLQRFGGDRLRRVEVIDNDPGNPRATIVADLAEADSLSTDSFDCLVVMQTLQYLARPEIAVAGCLRALRPGGTLLLAVPALAPHDQREAETSDHWRFWPAGVASMLRRVAPDLDHQVTGYGNLVASLAFLHGLCAEELKPAELLSHDPRFPIVVCARTDRPRTRE